MMTGVRTGALLGAAVILAAGCSRSLTPENGRCGPTPHLLVGASSYPVDADVGSAQVVVTGMVLDGSDLYFVVNGSPAPGNLVQLLVPGAVMRVSTYGGAPTEIAGGYAFELPTLTPTSLLLGEIDVTPSGSEVDIASVPRDGGSPTILATLTNDQLRTSPVTDGTSVYFSDIHGLESVPLSPTSPPAAPTTLLPLDSANIGVFGQRLLLVMPDGDVESLPIAPGDAGTSTTSLGAGSAPLPQTLIPCGSNACWLAAGEIDQVDPTAGPPTTIATMIALSESVAEPSGLVFDGKTFFVVGVGGSSAASAAIVSVPSQGGVQNVVAILPSPGPIAVDDACVYFSTSTGIFSLLKNSAGVVIP